MGTTPNDASLNALLNLALAPPETAIRQQAIGLIAELPSTGLSRSTELSDSLARAWFEVSGINDVGVSSAIATALAAVGGTARAELLLASLRGQEVPLKELLASSDTIRIVAFSALTVFGSTDAVPAFARELNSEPPRSLSVAASAYALTSISHDSAAAALSQWIKEANSDSANLIGDVIQEMSGSTLKFVMNEVGPNANNVRNSRVRETVVRAAANRPAWLQ